jgi:formyl-CoA transferase
VVENFRPGTLNRIGLGPDHLREQKPELIYASISGFGQGYPDLPGYDHIVQGTSGLMSLNGYATAPPVKVGIPIGDLSAGMFAVHAILAALHARGGTGVGAYIDVGMQDSLLALLTFQAGRYLATGAVPGRSGNRHPTISPYGTYRTSDGYLNLAAGTDRLWRKLCAALGLQTLIGDARFLTNSDRVTNGSALDEEIEVVLQEKGTTHWLNVLGEASVPCGPIRTVSEAFADRMVDERGSLMRMDHRAAGDIETVSPPWRIDGANMAADRPPPTLGQHTVEILKEVRSLAELEQRIIGGLG